MDEMAIVPKLEYDTSSGSVRGYATFPFPEAPAKEYCHTRPCLHAGRRLLELEAGGWLPLHRQGVALEVFVMHYIHIFFVCNTHSSLANSSLAGPLKVGQIRK